METPQAKESDTMTMGITVIVNTVGYVANGWAKKAASSAYYALLRASIKDWDIVVAVAKQEWQPDYWTSEMAQYRFCVRDKAHQAIMRNAALAATCRSHQILFLDGDDMLDESFFIHTEEFQREFGVGQILVPTVKLFGRKTGIIPPGKVPKQLPVSCLLPPFFRSFRKAPFCPIDREDADLFELLMSEGVGFRPCPEAILHVGIHDGNYSRHL